jgi:asparagine N-glycosylation enzyme membrane subunit Stt3
VGYILVASLTGMIMMITYTIFTQRLKNWVYLLPIGGLLLIFSTLAVSIVFVGDHFYPPWFNYIVAQIHGLVFWHLQSTTAEELPLLITLGAVTPEVPLAYFSVAFYLTFIGIGMLIYKWIKYNDVNVFLLLVWTLVMLLPTLAMRRFAYYFAINVITLSAIVVWELCKFNYERVK